jgi:hypothetical protein
MTKENLVARFEVFKVVTMKNADFWDVTTCGSCKNRVSEELGFSSSGSQESVN